MSEQIDTLGDALPREITRVRDVLMPRYLEIGPAGAFALAMMRRDLDLAVKALAEQDGRRVHPCVHGAQGVHGLSQDRRDDKGLRWVLKVLTGSRAHGLNTETSDYDYRGVFVQATEEILSLGGKVKETSWIEGREPTQAGAKEDDTAWEIGHFLFLATKCNPTILEVFAAPEMPIYAGDLPEPSLIGVGEGLRELFPYVWNPTGVRDAFVGYGLNQRKKMLDDKDKRAYKYATAYLRTLIQAEELLEHGVMRVDFRTHEEYQTLMLFRNGMATIGQVVDKCDVWIERVRAAHAECRHEPDLTKVNNFLLNVRRSFWSRP